MKLSELQTQVATVLGEIHQAFHSLSQEQAAKVILELEKADAAISNMTVAEVRQRTIKDLGLTISEEEFVRQYVYGEEA